MRARTSLILCSVFLVVLFAGNRAGNAQPSAGPGASGFNLPSEAMVDGLKMAAEIQEGEDDDRDVFRQEVLTNPKVVVVEFVASSCPPCQSVRPAIEKICAAYRGRVKLVRIDIHENRGLAWRYDVPQVPYAVVFKGGRPIEHIELFKETGLTRLVSTLGRPPL